MLKVIYSPGKVYEVHEGICPGTGPIKEHVELKNMITVIASIVLKEEHFLNEFLQIFKKNIPAVRDEKGCIEYYPAVDLPTDLPPQEQDRRVVTVIEKWESVEHLNMHLVAPHMKQYRQATDHLVDEVTIKILQNA